MKVEIIYHGLEADLPWLSSFLELDFNDSNKITQELEWVYKDGKYIHTENHIYKKFGTYNIFAHLWNNVSSVNLETKIEVDECIASISAQYVSLTYGILFIF